MKKEKTKPFTVKPLPTHFELVLVRKDKEGLKKVLDWLYEHGVSEFQWEWTMLERDEQYTLSIQSCWADNLRYIAELLSDADYDKE